MGKLNKSLGLSSLTFYGIGMILGAGIYSIIGAAAAEAREGLWMSFALSSFVVLLTAFSYAELSTMFPEAGAEFIYLRQAFPKYHSVAFVTSFFIALSGCATAATVSIAFAGYLNHFVEMPTPLTALAVLVLACGIAIAGIRESSWVNIIFTLIELGGLVLFIVIGMQSPKFAEDFLRVPLEGVFSGAALVFFSYLGFENIANFAEEAKEPDKSLPRAILLSVVIATAVYVLVALSAVALLDPMKLSKSASPLTTAANQASTKVGGVLGGIALFATANTALISLIAVSRIFFSIARKKNLPEIFSKTHSKRKTPWAATLLAFFISALLLPLGKVAIVASVSSLSSLLAFSSVNVALLRLRFKKPSVHRPFQVPLSVKGVPLFPLLSLLFLIALLTQFEPLVYIVGGGALLLIGIFYICFRPESRK